MSGTDHWLSDLDTSGDVHVTSTAEGIHIFYTEEVEEYVRTDYVVDVSAYR